jgi:hypothetical protein
MAIVENFEVMRGKFNVHKICISNKLFPVIIITMVIYNIFVISSNKKSDSTMWPSAQARP